MSYWSDPAQAILEITPDDDADNCDGCRAILCEVAGDAKVTDSAGNTVTIPMQQGYNPIRLKRVWSTDTTATGLFALY